MRPNFPLQCECHQEFENSSVPRGNLVRMTVQELRKDDGPATLWGILDGGSDREHEEH